MPTITGVSANALSSLSKVQPQPATKASTTGAAAKGVDTADTVKISAETRSELAQGKPFFSTAGAEGEATTEAAAGGRAERARKNESRIKRVRKTKLQGQADGVQERGAGKLEKMKKRTSVRREKIGGKLQTEEAKKKTKAGDLQKRIGGSEERVKTQSADKVALLSEKAKKKGVEVDQGRLDRIGDRVKDESAQKDTRLEGADARRVKRERQVKARGKDRLTRLDGNSEQRAKQIQGSTTKKLGGLEERMKKLDPVKTDDGGEQKIKASQAPATDATAQTASTTKTDVL